MRKKYLFLPLLLLLLNFPRLFAQITLTESDFSSYSQYIEANIEDSTKLLSVSPGTAGTNQTWDFSNLPNYDYLDTSGSVLPSQTPYASDFPNSNYASYNKDSDTGIAYGLLNSQGAYLNGWVEISALSAPYIPSPMIAHYQTPMTLYKFPINYGDTLSSGSNYTTISKNYDSNTSMYFDSIRYTYIITNQYKVDGWGTLKLPDASYEALRLFFKSKAATTLEAHYLGNWMPLDQTSLTTYSYTWLTNDIYQILEIDYDSAASHPYSAYYYKDALSGIQKATKPTSLSVFPNPASGSVTIRSANNDSYSITDQTGTVVKSGMTDEPVILSDLTEGIYFVRIISPEDTRVEKLIIRR